MLRVLWTVSITHPAPKSIISWLDFKIILFSIDGSKDSFFGKNHTWAEFDVSISEGFGTADCLWKEIFEPTWEHSIVFKHENISAPVDSETCIISTCETPWYHLSSPKPLGISIYLKVFHYSGDKILSRSANSTFRVSAASRTAESSHERAGQFKRNVRDLG